MFKYELVCDSCNAQVILITQELTNLNYCPSCGQIQELLDDEVDSEEDHE